MRMRESAEVKVRSASAVLRIGWDKRCASHTSTLHCAPPTQRLRLTCAFTKRRCQAQRRRPRGDVLFCSPKGPHGLPGGPRRAARVLPACQFQEGEPRWRCGAVWGEVGVDPADGRALCRSGTGGCGASKRRVGCLSDVRVESCGPPLHSDLTDFAEVRAGPYAGQPSFQVGQGHRACLNFGVLGELVDLRSYPST
jgi:hypothetical protein